MRRKLFLSTVTIFVLLTCSLAITVKASSTIWNRTYGREYDDFATCVITTSDGGYALTGYTLFSEISGDPGYYWLVKTDAYGNMEWNRTYGEETFNFAFSVVELSDGGYAIVGYTKASGEYEYWLVKTDENGNMEWNRTYRGAHTGSGSISLGDRSLVATSDGGCVLACYTNSFGTDWNDFWLIKIDAYGNMEWNKTYGGPENDRAYAVVETPDGGYAIAGETNCTSECSGMGDFLLVKTDEYGNMEWNRTYTRTPQNLGFLLPAFSLVTTSDGGYALVGSTGVDGVEGIWGIDVLLIKTDESGNVEWNQTYGGTEDIDWVSSMVETSDGGYVIGGNTASSGAGNYDFWLFKTDADGNMQWKKTCGGTGDDRAYSVVETPDGKYAITGFTGSFGNGKRDFWLVKTDGCADYDFETYEFDFSYGYGEYVVVISTNSTVGGFDFGINQDRISFSVTGPTGTTGSATIVIPEDLTDGDFPVYLNELMLLENA